MTNKDIEKITEWISDSLLVFLAFAMCGVIYLMSLRFPSPHLVQFASVIGLGLFVIRLYDLKMELKEKELI
jgi:uncharacterized membrane protein (DUF373 family)